MKGLASFVWGIIGILLGLFLWQGITGRVLPENFLQTHLLDVVMGVLCFLWLLVILKAPWDLYFKARQVEFEQSRATERSIVLEAGHENYVRRLHPRLLLLAIGTHLFSAALIATITAVSHGKVGYYFAVFYLVSTAFRPLLAGYEYLMGKLHALSSAAYFPRFDSVELEQKLRVLEEMYRLEEERYNALNAELYREKTEREEETFQLRQSITEIGNEFEATISRVSTNEEVVRGLGALVAFVRQTAPR